MEAWLNCFKQGNYFLILDGKTYTESDCSFIAEGSQKRIFKLKDTGLCFFIPNKYSNEENWNALIKKEKVLLDHILALGLEAQHFDIVPLTIQNADGNSHTLNVLLTQDFDTLARERNLVIYNPKPGSTHSGRAPNIIGNAPPFYSLKEHLKAPIFARKLLSKIINEFAIAFSFSLPLPSLGFLVDDSVHYCFELPNSATEPPIIRYIFWDITYFDKSKVPFVPTLNALKKEIHELAREVALAIQAGAEKEIYAQIKPGDFPLSFLHEFTNDIQTLIKPILMNEEFLAGALGESRKVSIHFLMKLMDGPELQHNIAQNPLQFLKLMQSAISTADLDIVKKLLELHPDHSILSLHTITAMIDTAVQYENSDLIVYLTNFKLDQITLRLQKEEEDRKALKEKFKTEFLTAYNLHLDIEQKSGFGFGRFFYKNEYITENMSLEQLIDHAQGQGAPGSTGARSHAVMQDLGWLTASGKLCNDLAELCKPSKAPAHSYP